MTKSTGRQKERNDRTRRIIEDAFDEIIRLVSSGVPMVKAIAYVPGEPTRNAVRNWMRNNPAQRERFTRAKIAANGSTGQSAYSPAAWDAALVSMETADEALSQIKRQGEPDYNACLRRAQRDPVFGAKFEAALARRRARPDKRPARFTAAEYDQAIQILLDNPDRPMAELEAEFLRLRLPALGSLYGAKQRKSVVADKMAQVSASRGIQRYSEEAHAEALAIVQDAPDRARAALRKHAGRLPSFNAIRSRALSNHATREAFEASRLSRRLNRSRMRAERRSRPVYRDHVLKSGLLLDQLYAEASKLFHSAIEDRDDMISEVVLAVLEGEIDRQDIAGRGTKVGWAYFNRLRNRRFDSLDRAAFDSDDSPSFGDLLTSDQWSHEGAI